MMLDILGSDMTCRPSLSCRVAYYRLSSDCETGSIQHQNIVALQYGQEVGVMEAKNVRELYMRLGDGFLISVSAMMTLGNAAGSMRRSGAELEVRTGRDPRSDGMYRGVVRTVEGEVLWCEVAARRL